MRNIETKEIWLCVIFREAPDAGARAARSLVVSPGRGEHLEGILAACREFVRLYPEHPMAEAVAGLLLEEEEVARKVIGDGPVEQRAALANMGRD